MLSEKKSALGLMIHGDVVRDVLVKKMYTVYSIGHAFEFRGNNGNYANSDKHIHYRSTDDARCVQQVLGDDRKQPYSEYASLTKMLRKTLLFHHLERCLSS